MAEPQLNDPIYLTLDPDSARILRGAFRRPTWVSGVYLLRFRNGKFYIGSSRDVRARIWDHQTKLNTHIHHNPKVQAQWDAFGFMEASTLIVCRESDLIFYEQLFIDKLRPQLNISRIAGRNGWSDESRLQLSRSRKGYKHTKETREKISRSKKGNPTGNVFTPEILGKMSASMKGKNTRVRTQEWKDKISKTLLELGKTTSRSQDVRDRIGKTTKALWESRSPEERSEIARRSVAARKAKKASNVQL